MIHVIEKATSNQGPLSINLIFTFKVYLYLFNLRPNISKSWLLNTHLIPINSDFIKQIKMTIVVLSILRVKFETAYKSKKYKVILLPQIMLS